MLKLVDTIAMLDRFVLAADVPEFAELGKNNSAPLRCSHLNQTIELRASQSLPRLCAAAPQRETKRKEPGHKVRQKNFLLDDFPVQTLKPRIVNRFT
jgi:hypothetical protein